MTEQQSMFPEDSGRQDCCACGNWKRNCLCPLVNYTPPVEDGPPRVVAAAILSGDVVYALPPPGRHHNVLILMKTLGMNTGREEQGFLLSSGRFASRKESRFVAAARGQLLPRAYCGDDLFSECMW